MTKPRSIALTALLLSLPLVGCRTYDGYTPVTEQDGLIPADQFARYGREQAQSVAIGRELAAAHDGDSPAAYAKQMGIAVAYARSLPDVVTVTPDTLGHRLTVTFASGWRVGIVPIADGKRGADTPGLSAAQ